MGRFTDALRDRRFSLLLLTVFLPSLLVSVMAVLVFRAERTRDHFQSEQRRTQITRLFNNELGSLLLSSRDQARPFLSLEIDKGDVVFSNLNAVLTQIPPPPSRSVVDELKNAERAEYRGGRASVRLARRGYLRLAGGSGTSSVLARLALLRLALRDRNSKEAFRWLEQIRSRDGEALTHSGIPIWLSAGVLFATSSLRCSDEGGETNAVEFYEDLGKSLLAGRWRIRTTQWILFSREILDVILFCSEQVPASLNALPELIPQVSRVLEQTGEIGALQNSLDEAAPYPVVWRLFSGLESVLIIVKGQPTEAFWLSEQNFIELANRRLRDLTVAEDFSAAVGRSTAKDPAVRTVDGFHGFELKFETKADVTWLGHVRRYLVLYATSSLLIMSVLGFVFAYRALSAEIEVTGMKSDFVAGVSHEFRSPLTSIQALLERIESGRAAGPDMRKRYLSAIRDEIERLNDLVSHLLDFSRMKRGIWQPQQESQDLREIAAAAVTGRGRFPGSDRLELTNAGPGPILVRIDRAAITRCIHNLIENALTYSSGDSPVKVRVGIDLETAFVEVEDRGIGIPAREQARIFEEFYRGSDAQSCSARGTGLGLALVKQTMQQHGGDVEVESRPSRGSCFRLTLPLDPAHCSGKDSAVRSTHIKGAA